MSISLISSGSQFVAYRPPSDLYVDLTDLTSHSTTFNQNDSFSGFIVIKNVFSKSLLHSIRDSYYSCFGSEYLYKHGAWHHTRQSVLMHGVGSHPSRAFVRSKTLLDFVKSPILKFISSVLLGCDNPVLCPRVIVRSFDAFSQKTTNAHRDCDYFHSTDSSKVITAWIPLGPADIKHGQLVYLKDSHHDTMQNKLSKIVKTNRTISSDLSSLASSFETQWYIPNINEGDIIFHCLKNVHASFDNKTEFPRLSCDIRFASSLQYMDPKWSGYWSGDDGL